MHDLNKTLVQLVESSNRECASLRASLSILTEENGQNVLASAPVCKSPLHSVNNQLHKSVADNKNRRRALSGHPQDHQQDQPRTTSFSVKPRTLIDTNIQNLESSWSISPTKTTFSSVLDPLSKPFQPKSTGMAETMAKITDKKKKTDLTYHTRNS